MSERPSIEEALGRLFATKTEAVGTLYEAAESQHYLVELAAHSMGGEASLSGGDYGVATGGLGKQGGSPRVTAKVQEVLAHYLGAEEALFVWGAGTGAIGTMLHTTEPGRLLIHDGPAYKTTRQTLATTKWNTVAADFHDTSELQRAADNADAALIQRIPHAAGDHWTTGAVITALRAVNPTLAILVDDNYAVGRFRSTPAQLGATASAFSLFKLQGPEGVGLIAGTRAFVDKVRPFHASGGSQIQGPTALESLRSLITAPLEMAFQHRVMEQSVRLIRQDVEAGSAWTRNILDVAVLPVGHLNIVIALRVPMARAVLQEAWANGGAPYPVGEESRYEVMPLFYRLGSSFLAADPILEAYTLRINPMKAGPEFVRDLLRSALEMIH